MKTNIFILTFLTYSLIAFGQIPNPSFEQWTSSRPVGWHSVFHGAPYIFETQDTTAYQGNYAVRSTIVQTGPVASVAGIMTGDVTWTGYNEAMNEYGYIPITIRPTILYGWYILHNNNQDTMTANIWFKNSGVIIGTGEFTTTAAKSTFNQFIININYTSVVQPDSFKIFITFNHHSPSTFDNAGAYFIVDSLHFDILNSIKEIDNSSKIDIKVYPNPSNDYLTFQLIDNYKLKLLEIYNSQGLRIDNVNLNTATYIHDTRKYKAGIYHYILTLNNESLINGQFIKD